MRPFNLKEYLANPSMKLVTRDGRNARIICTDRKVDSYTKCTIVALVANKEGYEACVELTKNGKYQEGFEGPYDLFFVPEKREGWLNIYNSNIGIYVGSGYVYGSLIEAKDHIREDLPYLSTIKVEWEE